MEKRKTIFFFAVAILVLSVWNLSETVVTEAKTGEITVTGRIGETAKKEEEVDNDQKKTIVADVSQIGQMELPQTGSSNTVRWIIYGSMLVLLFFYTYFKRKRRTA